MLQQQGRVQLDADTNEQTAILLHYLRTLAADLIGPYGGPAGDGFRISPTQDGKDLEIDKGRYYVDGILCENEVDITTTYKNQPDYPNPPDLPENGESYLVYLDVWEQHITALEDDGIREKALGGPDTATRTKVVWQVKVEETGAGGINSDLLQKLKHGLGENGFWQEKFVEEFWQSKNCGCLKARVKPAEESTDPCLIAPDAKYRGQENQLYRIEIHRKGKAKPSQAEAEEGYATFKWSRDNGSVVTRVVKFSGTELTVEKPQGFEPGIWVELINESQELRGEPGSLVKLIKVEGDHFTLGSEVSRPSDLPEKEDWPTKVRRWDQHESGYLKLKDGAVPITEVKKKEDEEGDWIEIENGIEIQFQKSDSDSEENAHQYRTGNYWLIPARVATGDIEWPEDEKSQPIEQSPHGVQHHYAPLAVIRNDSSSPEDLRFELEPLGEPISTTTHKPQ